MKFRLMMVATCLSLIAASSAPAPAGARQPEPLVALVFTTGAAWDTTRAPNLQPGFASHSRNLARLRGEGRIAFGGRYGPAGLVVVRAAGEEEARGLLVADSSLIHGSFQVAVHRWRTIYTGQVN